ncbi:MAG: class I SAM-dependent methyltransferase [Nanoarchaeota archaeon]|nr:class I SAM-dependent methyltransferase [Nanoarchaeota archaeon]
MSRQEYWNCNTACTKRFSETFPRSILPRISLGMILDLGCSSGQTTQHIADIYPDSAVIGIDINYKKIKEAREINTNPNIEFLLADGYQMPFSNLTFDAAFCMNNLNQAIGCEMISKERIVEIANEIARVIKPRGYLMFSGQDKSIMQKMHSGFEMRYYYFDSSPQPSQTLFEALNNKTRRRLRKKSFKAEVVLK